MKTIRIALLTLALCLAVAACAQKRSPSQQLAGSWIFDYETTIADPQMQDLAADPDFNREFKDYMEGLQLDFDFERQVLTLAVQGEDIEEMDFEVISESAPDGLVIIKIDSDRLSCRISGNRLYLRDEGDLEVPPLVYKRLP